jgi:hypothetical protein
MPVCTNTSAKTPPINKKEPNVSASKRTRDITFTMYNII